jgi:hypothetical protein
MHKDENSVLQDSNNILLKFWNEQEDEQKQPVPLSHNPNIIYSRYDFDGDLLEKKDWASLFQTDPEAPKIRTSVAKKFYDEKCKWNELSQPERIIHNYAVWLSLRRKGEILLKAYYEQILPQIESVVYSQKEISLKDEQGNEIRGTIDAVVKMRDSQQVVIVDNKTAAFDYEDDSVSTSIQLSLYQFILNQLEPGLSALSGYLVMSKKLDKTITKTCQSCGFQVTNDAHKTCHNEINNKRCGGKWDVSKVFHAKTQILIDKISAELQDLVMSNVSTVQAAIEQNVFPRNFGACKGRFGTCEYFNLCYYRNKDGLIKLPDREETKKGEDNGKT